MKKKYLYIIMSACVLWLIPRPTLAGGKISLRLWGGWSYLGAGDVNSGTQAFFDWGKNTYLTPGGTIEGGYEPIHSGYEFGGDIIFQLSPKIGVGLGAGYLKSSKNPSTHPGMMVINLYPPYNYAWGMTFNVGTTLSAIPLRLGVFLTLPIKEKLSFTANAGICYYLQAEYHADWGVGVLNDFGTGPDSRLSTTAEKKTAGFGLQGGVGIEYKFIRSAGFFIEAQGRYAKFKGFEGTSISVPNEFNGGILPSFSETGKLYYEMVPTIPGSPRWIMVQNAPPAGPGGTPRQAAVDFSGVSFIAGIKIHF